MKARCLLLGFALGAGALTAGAADWPQWRGANRDAKVTGFTAPKSWPKDLTQKWKVTVGEGDATPALVGDKLYVFSRQDGNEVTRCLDAATGNEVWKDQYPSAGAEGGAKGHSGPRASPTVADGKVVTHGVRGVLSCLDAATGKVIWRKDDQKGNLPQFFVSNSPVITDGLCVAQLGGEKKGVMVGYDLASGNEKWRWDGDGTAYASPTLMTVDGLKAVVTLTAANVVAVGLDGKLLWKESFAGGQRAYNSATPIVDGQTVIITGPGRGVKAIRLEKQGDQLAGKELWANPDNSPRFNNPVLKDGLIYGLSDRDTLFCIDAKSGKTAWTSSLPGGPQGFGSIVDAGPVLFAMNPTAQLTVFEPSDKEFKKVAGYKIGGGGAYAYPIVSGNRIYAKDSTSLILWTIE